MVQDSGNRGLDLAPFQKTKPEDLEDLKENFGLSETFGDLSTTTLAPEQCVLVHGRIVFRDPAEGYFIRGENGQPDYLDKTQSMHVAWQASTEGKLVPPLPAPFHDPDIIELSQQATIIDNKLATESEQTVAAPAFEKDGHPAKFAQAARGPGATRIAPHKQPGNAGREGPAPEEA